MHHLLQTVKPRMTNYRSSYLAVALLISAVACAIVASISSPMTVSEEDKNISLPETVIAPRYLQVASDPQVPEGSPELSFEPGPQAFEDTGLPPPTAPVVAAAPVAGPDTFPGPPVPCPETPEGGCSVCGEGRCVNNPDVLFTFFPGEPPIPCDLLQEVGYDGLLIDIFSCDLLPTSIVDVCGCMTDQPGPDIPYSPNLPPGLSPGLPPPSGYGSGGRCVTGFETSLTYHIIARHSDKLLGSSLSENGGAPAVVQSSDRSSRSTRWNLRPIAGSEYYHIMNEETGLALNVKGASSVPGAPVLQWPLTFNAPGNGNDEWCFFDDSEEVGSALTHFHLVVRHSDLVLDIDKKSCQEGAHSIQWNRKTSGAGNQQFRVEPALDYNDYSTFGGTGWVSIQEYESILEELKTCREAHTLHLSPPIDGEPVVDPRDPDLLPPIPLEGECDETNESSQTTESTFDIGGRIRCTSLALNDEPDKCPESFADLSQSQQQRTGELFVETYNSLAASFCLNLTEATVTAANVDIVPTWAPSLSSQPSSTPTAAPSGITPTVSPAPTFMPVLVGVDVFSDSSTFFGFTYKIRGTCKFCSPSGGFFGNDGFRRVLQSADGEECRCGAPSIQDFLLLYNEALFIDDAFPFEYYSIEFTRIFDDV